MVNDVTRAANALTARWARNSCTGRSDALSGAGVWPLLALLAAAADGPGRDELQEAVGVDAGVADAGARELLDTLAAGAAAGGAFGLWNSAGLPLEQWWLDAAPDGARGELTGDPATDQAELDAWVERRTSGRLRRMPVKVRPDTLLVLATALSIDTAWRHPFRDRPFRPRTGPWAGREAVGLFRHDGLDVDELALAETSGGPVTMLTVQGKDDVDVHLCLGEPDRPAGEVLAAGTEALDGGHPVRPGSALLEGPAGAKAPGVGLTMVRSHDPRPRLNVETVRFDVSASHDLMEHRELFGLAAVSTDAPDGHFPKISRKPLKIDQGAQDVTATFTARGFQAAAVTAFATLLGSAPPTHEAPVLDATFDRPFGFLARHRPSGLVLLAGWVAEPDDWPEDVEKEAGLSGVSPAPGGRRRFTGLRRALRRGGG